MICKKKHVLLALQWYHPKLHHGVAAYARKHAWHLNSELAYFPEDIPENWDGDGTISTYTTRPHPLEKFLSKSPAPMVLITNGVPGSPWPLVGNDNRLIAEMAANHFYERGFRRFAFLGMGGGLSSQRMDFFSECLNHHGIDVPNLREALNDQPDWRRKVTAWRRAVNTLRQGLPLALFCETDNIASEAILMSLEGGLDIPGDLAVVGVHNDELVCEASAVPISSVENNLFQIGYRAAELLDKLMEGEKINGGMELIPPTQVVIRQSSDTVAVTNPEVAKAVRFLRDNYQFGIGIGDLLKEVSVSERTLYALFQKHLGRKPAEELTRIRMEQAKKLLSQTSLSPQEVAERCGFNDIRTFYATFERTAKETPGQFRKRIRIDA